MNQKTTRPVIALLFVIMHFALLAISFWPIYLVWQEFGWIVAFFALGFALYVGHLIGGAPLFAISASVLHFRYHEVGLWLPLVSYAWAVFTFIMQRTLLKEA